jgi:nucleoside-diphosphate-sugar epimerase
VPQRILVLGASGYIGQHLTTVLSQQGHQVLAAARSIERLQKQNLPNVTCHSVDLNWPQGLSRCWKVSTRFIIWCTAWVKAVILSPMSARWR